MTFLYAGELSAGSVTLPAGGEVAVIALDEAGLPQWGTSFDANDDIEIQGIGVGADSSVYVAGVTFSSQLDLGDGVSLTGSSVAQWGFAVKLDNTGTAQWAQKISTPWGIGNARLAVRGNTIAWGGFYSNNETFAYTSTTGLTVAPGFGSNGHRAYALSLSPDTGAANWLVRHVRSGQDTRLTGVAVDASGGILLAYEFGSGSVVDDQGAAVATVDGGAKVGLVTRLDATGAVSWAKGFGATGTGTAEVESLATNGAGLVVAAGQFEGTVDWGDGERTAAAQDPFVAALDGTTGALQWVKAPTTADAEAVLGIGATSGGDIVMNVVGSGVTNGETFDGLSLPSTPGPYLVGFNASGDARWLYHVESNPTAPGLVGGGRVAVSDAGMPALIGNFTGPVDFGAGLVDGEDVYVLGVAVAD